MRRFFCLVFALSISLFAVLPVSAADSSSDVPEVIDGLRIDQFSDFSWDSYHYAVLDASSEYTIFPAPVVGRPSYTLQTSSEQELVFSSPVSMSTGNEPDSIGLVSYPLYTSDLEGVGYFQLDFTFQTSVSAFELSGTLASQARLVSDDGSVDVQAPCTACQVIVGESVVDVPMAVGQNGVIDFNNFIYDDASGQGFTSFSLRFFWASVYESYDKADFSGTMSLTFTGDDFGVPSVGGGGDGSYDPSGFIEDTGALQENIDGLDSMEQEFFGSMEDNFNALNIDSFTVPDGVLSGFTLALNVFSSVWAALGAYQILFTFPLMLSIVLLIIGRISKSAGHKDSSSKGGDS